MIKILCVKAEAKSVLTRCKKWIRSVVIVINMIVLCSGRHRELSGEDAYAGSQSVSSVSSSPNPWCPPSSSSQRYSLPTPSSHTTQTHFLNNPDHHSQPCLCLALLCAPFWCYLVFLLKSVLGNSTHFQYFNIHPSPNSSIEASWLLGTQSKAKHRERGWIVSWCLTHSMGVHTVRRSPRQGSLCIISLLQRRTVLGDGCSRDLFSG